MRAAYAALAAALLLVVASSASAAVTCGDLGSVQYISGCTACTAVNVTFAGHDDKHSGKSRKDIEPLHKNRDNSWGSSGSKLLPNCTECNADAFFELRVKPGNTSWSAGKPSMARCGCMSGYGVKITGNVTVTWGNKTRSKPTFECVKCGDAQVTLGPGSGVMPVYDKLTKAWRLVLISSINTPAKAKKYGLKYPVTAASLKPSGDGRSGPWGDKGHKDGRDGKDDRDGKDGRGGRDGRDGKGPGAFGPYTPGQCIDCPTGSKKDGVACVKA